MFCSHCGKEIDANTRFCTACGTPIDSGKPSSSKSSDVAWESKAIQVHPALENDTIETYEAFGWELMSSQTIDKQDTHLENSFGVINSVTEYEKYVKLTFRRNKKMPSYAEICKLEDEYYSAVCTSEPNEPSVIPLVAGAFLSLCAFIPGFIGLLLIGVILIGVYTIKKRKYNKLYSDYLEEYEKAEEIQSNCIAKAQELT